MTLSSAGTEAAELSANVRRKYSNRKSLLSPHISMPVCVRDAINAYYPVHLKLLKSQNRNGEKMTIQKETYPVLGMTCAVCVAKIEKVLGNTDGINEASVNFASENVTINYDDDIISLEKITGIIKNIGYELLT